MNVMLQYTNSDGSTELLERCLSFRLVRDRYLPFAVLHVRMLARQMNTQPFAVRFYIDGKLLYEGITQKAEYVREQDQWVLVLTARSYTAALTKNQLIPGIHWNVTLRQLMETYKLPKITYDDSMEEIRYIYVKDNAAMWDSIIAYNYKLCRGYPYIRISNKLCMMPQTGTVPIQIPARQILRFAAGSECGEMISRIDMANAAGEYGSFTMINEEAVKRGIVRVRQVLLDKQYVYDPYDALRFRIAVSNRKLESRTVTYTGYCFEDIEDLVQVGTILTARVNRIVLSGDEKGIVTADTFYFDPFCNTELLPRSY